MLGALVAAFGVTRSDDSLTGSAPSSDSSVADGVALSLAAQRAVAIRTTACGDTSRAFGSGVMVGPRQVLTAAHVVSGAGKVAVEVGSWSAVGDVVAYDTQRDLALVAVVEPIPLPVQGLPTFARLDVGEGGQIVGAAATGTSPFAVLDRTIIETDDVREPTRSRRAGYVVEAATERGDSGAGVYTSQGELVGLVFAVSAVTENRSFVTASEEVKEFLDEVRAGTRFQCDPAESKLAS